jgi:serine protease Do
MFHWFSTKGFQVLSLGIALALPGVACPSSGSGGPIPMAAAASKATLPSSAPEPAWAPPGQISDVAERAVKSVVNISSTRVNHFAGGGHELMPFFNDPFFEHFFGNAPGLPQQHQDLRQSSLGSGVVVSSDGLVLTNNHVIAGADDIRVTLAPGHDFKAKVVGADPRADLALIRLEGRGVNNLQPLPFGDSSRLRLGEVVLAIGSPFGLSQTVTMGIVSAVGRANVGIADYEDFIQTDAAINPGNSGGALVNLNGELVGINTAIATQSGGYQGVGFAIPSNMAKSIMESLLRTGKVVRGWLGVVIQGIDDDLATAMHLKDTRGVLVSDVSRDSPAAHAGLERGDVIVKFNGQPVDEPAVLRNAVAEQSVGSRANLEVIRDGRERNIAVTIGEQPASALGGVATAESQGVLSGVTVAPLDESNRAKYDISTDVTSGVVVTEVKPESPSAMAGLQAGDVIIELDREPIRSVADFQERYRRAQNKALLLVNRGGTTVYIVASR